MGEEQVEAFLTTLSSQLCLAMYSAQERTTQTEDLELAAQFKPLAESLRAYEKKIVDGQAACKAWPWTSTATAGPIKSRPRL
jgi:monomeric isocitrate dehydrogenase